MEVPKQFRGEDMTLYTLHHAIGWSLFVVMAGLIASGLTYKFAKNVPIRLRAKKLHLKLAYSIIALWTAQLFTVIFW